MAARVARSFKVASGAAKTRSPQEVFKSLDRAHEEACLALNQSCNSRELTLLAAGINIAMWGLVAKLFGAF